MMRKQARARTLANGTLPGLNTVRFAAALNVVFVHLALWLSIPNDPFFTGSDAVTIFFTLSGYLITYRLLIEQRETGTINIGAFYRRRALRILPLYYLVLLVGGVLLPVIGAPPVSAPALLSVALLVPQGPYALGTPPGLIVPLWSLGVEEVFYLSFPFALRRWGVVRVSVAVILLSTAMSAFAYATHNPILPLLRLMRLECMAVGALAAYLVIKQSPALRIVYHRAVEGGAMALLLAVAVLKIQLPAYDLTFSIIVAVFMVNISTNPRAWLRLEWHWSHMAGALSYGIYIWHLPVMWLVSFAVWNGEFVAGTILVTLGVAFASYHLIEQPIQRWGSRRRKRSMCPSCPGNTPNTMSLWGTKRE